MTTQKDIANRLGVSASLVSRVLAGKASDIGITEDTARRVQEAAQALGYVPNAAAQILKGASSLTIGVVVFDFEDPFFGAIIGNLQRLAHREQLSLLLVGLERKDVRSHELDPLLRHRLDGLIVVGSEPVTSWVDSFRERGIPIVRIGTGPGEDPFCRVGVDNEAGLLAALRHLHALGHRTVGALAAPIAPHRQRFKDFARLAAGVGLRCDPRWIITAGTSVYDAGEAAATALLNRGGPRPTALMTSSDLVAMGAMNALAGRGLHVPRELSVIGFDDIPVARLATPSLTTVRQPLEDLTAQAFALVNQPPPDPSKTIISLVPELVLRESTATPT